MQRTAKSRKKMGTMQNTKQAQWMIRRLTAVCSLARNSSMLLASSHTTTTTPNVRHAVNKNCSRLRRSIASDLRMSSRMTSRFTTSDPSADEVLPSILVMQRQPGHCQIGRKAYYLPTRPAPCQKLWRCRVHVPPYQAAGAVTHNHLKRCWISGRSRSPVVR